MSYILEALKKAQAERQLGGTPTLDAQPVHPPLIAGTRRPLTPAIFGALAAVVGVVAVGVVTQWWRAPQPAPVAVVAAPAQVPAPSAPAAAAPAAPAAPAPVSAAAPAPVSAATTAPVPAPVAVASAPPLVVAAPTVPVKEVVKPAPAPVAAVKPAPAPVAPVPPAADEHLPTLRELPENVRAAIPQLSLGGYMYSNNPSDRLILVDKVLRHEGEEVAPGLVLEKLLPKAAQMNYRGTRYLVPI